jgi:hypothetical protein
MYIARETVPEHTKCLGIFWRYTVLIKDGQFLNIKIKVHLYCEHFLPHFLERI